MKWLQETMGAEEHWLSWLGLLLFSLERSKKLRKLARSVNMPTSHATAATQTHEPQQAVSDNAELYACARHEVAAQARGAESANQGLEWQEKACPLFSFCY